jgi:hypothetical protein
MPQTGAAGFHRPDRQDSSRPPALTVFDPNGEISVTDNRAAIRAAAAERFAQRFGVDEEVGPSADALADRFGFRYEPSRADPAVASGRRTVTITGHGAGRTIPPAERTIRSGGGQGSRRGAGRRREPTPLRADRIAMLAVALALLLAFVAVTSAHAATLAGLAPLNWPGLTPLR